jgi:hypothetical protein
MDCILTPSSGHHSSNPSLFFKKNQLSEKPLSVVEAASLPDLDYIVPNPEEHQKLLVAMRKACGWDAGMVRITIISLVISLYLDIIFLLWHVFAQLQMFGK